MRSLQLRRHLAMGADDIVAKRMRFFELLAVLSFVSRHLALRAQLQIVDRWVRTRCFGCIVLEAISLEPRLAGRNKSRRALAKARRIQSTTGRMRTLTPSGDPAFGGHRIQTCVRC